MSEEENIADQNRKFFPYPLLLKAAKIARDRNYNRQGTDEFINKTVPKADPDQDFNYPIMFSMQHEHAQGEPVDTHMRCEILVLDVDMDLFIKLPDTSIYDQETGHLPSA